LEALVAQAGLTPLSARDVDVTWNYTNLDAALRALISAGPAVRAINTSGEARVREAVAEAINRFRLANGAYRLENKFCYLIAAT
jgi:hypothetical protein